MFEKERGKKSRGESQRRGKKSQTKTEKIGQGERSYTKEENYLNPEVCSVCALTVCLFVCVLKDVLNIRVNLCENVFLFIIFFTQPSLHHPQLCSC